MSVPRILMLPGWTQSASIYRGRMGAVRKAIGDKAELVFVDPVSQNRPTSLRGPDPGTLPTGLAPCTPSRSPARTLR